jgi:hypothetical protein
MEQRNRNWKKKEKNHSWENKTSKCAHGQFGSFLRTERIIGPKVDWTKPKHGTGLDGRSGFLP